MIFNKPSLAYYYIKNKKSGLYILGLDVKGLLKKEFYTHDKNLLDSKIYRKIVGNLIPAVLVCNKTNKIEKYNEEINNKEYMDKLFEDFDALDIKILDYIVMCDTIYYSLTAHMEDSLE